MCEVHGMISASEKVTIYSEKNSPLSGCFGV